MAREKISTTDGLNIKLKMYISIAIACRYAMKYPFLRGPKPPYRVFFNSAITRNFLRRISPRELKLICPPTTETYRTWARKKNQPIQIETIIKTAADEPDVNLLWVGKRWTTTASTQYPQTKPVIFYVHGGGFQLPLSRSHLNVCDFLRKEVASYPGLEEPSVVLLEYACTPEYRYPTQFRQAVIALSYLLEKGLSPSSIILAGDSAGGHILLSTISHMLHPHPAMPRMGPLPSPFAAVVLVSPAVNEEIYGKSMRTAAEMDVLDPALFTHWVNMFMRQTPMGDELAAQKYWGVALKAPSEWWAGLSRVVQRVHITAGDLEAPRDAIAQFASNLQQGVEGEGVPVELFLGFGESHDAPISHDTPMGDFEAGRPLSGTTRKLVEWIVSAIRDMKDVEAISTPPECIAEDLMHRGIKERGLDLFRSRL